MYPYEQFDNTVYTISKVMYLSLSVIGVLCNLLVIYIIAKNRKMQTITNIYLFNLAIISALIMLVLPLDTNKNWLYGYAMCKINVIITSITDFAVWLISLLFSAPIIYFSDLQITHSNESTSEDCRSFWKDSDLMSGEEAKTLYINILGFWFPFVMIAVSYVIILIELRKITFDQSARRRRKVTKFVAIIVSVYLICWLPYWVVSYINAIFKLEVKGGPSLLPFLITLYLSYMYTALNALLYAFVNPNFKLNMLRVFACVVPKFKPTHSEDPDYNEDTRKSSTKTSSIEKRKNTTKV
ncbi:somatostatin receptor type 5-like protein [Dinothrombium tinctorium]|uniref:Somatostatin receptor type 5-like protein n=1 Tax=Dinothrombium tinctorium TaxID=1965070 RepID=A0A3S3RV54_9ACAR|nr:somatostatin receptor type 5-like protein [Dinothrombium tinctorium]